MRWRVFSNRWKAGKKQLEGVQTQLEAAKGEVDRPFQKEAEYAEKSARLKELNILLNMDAKDKALLDAEPDEGDLGDADRRPRNRDDRER
jgi:hypothetical protein